MLPFVALSLLLPSSFILPSRASLSAHHTHTHAHTHKHSHSHSDTETTHILLPSLPAYPHLLSFILSYPALSNHQNKACSSLLALPPSLPSLLTTTAKGLLHCFSPLPSSLPPLLFTACIASTSTAPTQSPLVVPQPRAGSSPPWMAARTPATPSRWLASPRPRAVVGREGGRERGRAGEWIITSARNAAVRNCYRNDI